MSISESDREPGQQGGSICSLITKPCDDVSYNGVKNLLKSPLPVNVIKNFILFPNLRSLKEYIQTMKGQNCFWNKKFF